MASCVRRSRAAASGDALPAVDFSKLRRLFEPTQPEVKVSFIEPSADGVASKGTEPEEEVRGVRWVGALAYIRLYTYICIHIYVHLCTYIQVYIHILHNTIHTYIRICAHYYTYTCPHTSRYIWAADQREYPR